jgi:Ni,Fe-hydrogenase III component G
MKDVAKEYIPDGIAYEQHGDVVSFEVSPAEVVSLVRDYIDKNLPLTLIDATDERADNGCFKVWYVFGLPEKHYFIVPYIRVEKTEEFPSVASITPAAGGYERKIRTFFGLEPVGNPDSRPLILHENWPKGTYPLRKDFKQTTRPKTAKNQP